MSDQCPKCGAKLHCPCEACRKREPKGLTEKDHYHWEHGEIVCCPVCGFKDHVDFWETAAMKRAGF